MIKSQDPLRYVKKIDAITIEKGIITVKYIGGYIATHVIASETDTLFNMLLDSIVNDVEVPEEFKNAIILNIFEQDNKGVKK